MGVRGSDYFVQSHVTGSHEDAQHFYRHQFNGVPGSCREVGQTIVMFLLRTQTSVLET